MTPEEGPPFKRVRECWGIITPVYQDRAFPERVTLYSSEDDAHDWRPSPPYRLVRMRVTTEEVTVPVEQRLDRSAGET